MKIKYTLGLLFLMLCSFCSCRKPVNLSKDVTGGKYLYPLKNESQIGTDSLMNAVKDISYIKLDSKDTLITSGDNEIVAAGDNLVFVEREMAYALLIDPSGKVIKKLGSFGAKPKQYKSVNNVCYDKARQEILLFTSEKQSVLFYDAQGNYKKEIKLDFFASSVKILDNDRLAFFINQNRSETSESYDLLITDRDGKVTGRGYDWRPLPDISYGFSGGFSSSESNLFNVSYNDSLYEVSKDKIKLKYVVSFGDRGFPDKAKKHLKEMPKELWNYSALKLPLVETKNYLSLVFNDNLHMDEIIYNKNTGRSIKKTSIKDIFPINIFTGFSSATYADDCFYAILNKSLLLNHLKKTPKDWDVLKKFNPGLFQMAQKLRVGDNPVIIKFKYAF